jgi:CRP/FNR family transcriptional regulator
MPPRDAGDVVRGNPIFAGLPAKDLAALAAAARDVTYRAREYVFHEGEVAISFCLVKRGHVKILRHARSGKDVVLELLGPGEAFGGVAVIERRPYPASAQATEASVVTRIPQDLIIVLAERHPSIVREMALLIGQRLRTAHESVTSLAADPVEARLAAALVRIAEREGVRTRDRLTLPFQLTRQSLADMTGTTVETAIRVLGRWQREGLLDEEDGRLGLANLEALRERAEGGEA